MITYAEFCKVCRDARVPRLMRGSSSISGIVSFIASLPSRVGDRGRVPIRVAGVDRFRAQQLRVGEITPGRLLRPDRLAQEIRRRPIAQPLRECPGRLQHCRRRHTWHLSPTGALAYAQRFVCRDVDSNANENGLHYIFFPIFSASKSLRIVRRFPLRTHMCA